MPRRWNMSEDFFFFKDEMNYNSRNFRQVLPDRKRTESIAAVIKKNGLVFTSWQFFLLNTINYRYLDIP